MITLHISPYIRIARPLELPSRAHWYSWAALRAGLVICFAFFCLHTVAHSDDGIERTCETSPVSQMSPNSCQCPSTWVPTEATINEIISRHQIWDRLRLALIESQRPEAASAARAVFCNAVILVGNFSDINLAYADFRSSTIVAKAPLATVAERLQPRSAVRETEKASSASIGVEFRNSVLNGANFERAQLKGVSFASSILQKTSFVESDLTHADFSGSKLLETNLQGAIFEGVNLAGAIYSPSSTPSERYLGGITGLKDVTFPHGRPTALVKLRDLLRKTGLRELERQATFAIEHNRTKELIDGCPWRPSNARLRLSLNGSSLWRSCAHGVVRMLAFELTTEWGARPGRALLILLGLILMMTPVYSAGLLMARRNSAHVGGIFLVFPENRVQVNGVRITTSQRTCARRLRPSLTKTPLWALYFSVISTFKIGWRDFNLGTWIARLQLDGYELRSRGWIRVVSGLQSIIGVYLFAIWILTYFERPFQ